MRQPRRLLPMDGTANWAGYALTAPTGSTVDSVIGSHTVPTIHPR
ncbi:MAG: hypothetical protein ACP5O1_02515 [Phycisphaerae bacterium]